jgi:nucleoside-diphosphate-sugar epimerase
LVGVTVQPIHREPRPGDVRHSLADIAKAKALLGYRPCTDFLVGLGHTVEWYRNHNGHVS